MSARAVHDGVGVACGFCVLRSSVSHRSDDGVFDRVLHVRAGVVEVSSVSEYVSSFYSGTDEISESVCGKKDPGNA